MDQIGTQERIDINQQQAVSFWTQQLGVSEAALRFAVADVGVSAEDVRLHLGMAPSGAGAMAAGHAG